MIGFITTKQKAESVNTAIAKAQTDRGSPVFWLMGSLQVNKGEHTGYYFMPCDDHVLSTPLAGSPPQTPMDFPEFLPIIQELGGLDARVDVPESDIATQDEYPN